MACSRLTERLPAITLVTNRPSRRRSGSRDRRGLIDVSGVSPGWRIWPTTAQIEASACASRCAATRFAAGSTSSSRKSTSGVVAASSPSFMACGMDGASRRRTLISIAANASFFAGVWSTTMIASGGGSSACKRRTVSTTISGRLKVG